MVSASDSNIRFTLVSGSGISTLSLSAVSGNTGYKDLFVGTNTTYTERTAASSGTNTRSPQITFDISIGTVIDSSNDTFVVVVDGESKSVRLDHGEITADNADGIIDAINNALGLGDTITYNRTSQMSMYPVPAAILPQAPSAELPSAQSSIQQFTALVSYGREPHRVMT